MVVRTNLQDRTKLQYEVRKEHVEYGQPEEWVTAINQWDIPAVFGLDPLFSPMDVKLEKHGRRSPSRCGRAFATMASVVATVVADNSWGNLMTHRILRHPEQRHLAVQAVVSISPHRGKTTKKRPIFGLFLPVAVPYLFESPEAVAAGWGRPFGQDDTAVVPPWARLVGLFGQGITKAKWVRIAVSFADHRVVLYRMRLLEDDCTRVVSRAAAWWLANLPGGMNGQEAAQAPLTGIHPLNPVLGNQTVLALCQTGARLTAERDALEQRIRQTDAAILKALGPHRAIIDAEGTVRARIAQRPDLLLADGPIPKGLPIRVVSPPSEVVYERSHSSEDPPARR